MAFLPRPGSEPVVPPVQRCCLIFEANGFADGFDRLWAGQWLVVQTAIGQATQKADSKVKARVEEPEQTLSTESLPLGKAGPNSVCFLVERTLSPSFCLLGTASHPVSSPGCVEGWLGRNRCSAATLTSRSPPGVCAPRMVLGTDFHSLPTFQTQGCLPALPNRNSRDDLVSSERHFLSYLETGSGL